MARVLYFLSLPCQVNKSVGLLFSFSSNFVTVCMRLRDILSKMKSGSPLYISFIALKIFFLLLISSVFYTTFSLMMVWPTFLFSSFAGDFVGSWLSKVISSVSLESMPISLRSSIPLTIIPSVNSALFISSWVMTPTYW